MESVLQTQAGKLYSRHAAATDRASWSVVKDVRWGDIDVNLAQSQQELLLTVRRVTLGLSARGARVVRVLHELAGDPHASAVLTLDLWDGLKHLHALRTYLDTVEFAPRISDGELAAVRTLEATDAPPGDTSGLLRLLFTQHLAAISLRHVGARAAEPVLAELLALMAADEARHAQIVSDLLALRVGAGLISRDDLRAEAASLREQAQSAAVEIGAVADDLAVQTFLKRAEMLCA